MKNDGQEDTPNATALLQQIDSSGSNVQELNQQEAHVLKFAMHSFAENGYAATSIRNIAAAAGVTAPTINYYFGSKEGLYRRLVSVVTGALKDQFGSVSGLEGPFEKRLLDLVGQVIEFATTWPTATAFMFDALYGPRAGRPMVDLDLLEELIHGIVGKLIADAVASGEVRLRADYKVEDVQRLCVMVMEHVIGKDIARTGRVSNSRRDEMLRQAERLLSIILRGAVH